MNFGAGTNGERTDGRRLGITPHHVGIRYTVPGRRTGFYVKILLVCLFKACMAPLLLCVSPLLLSRYPSVSWLFSETVDLVTLFFASFDDDDDEEECFIFIQSNKKSR